MILPIALCLWVVGFLVLFRIPLCRSGRDGHEYPELSIIVPARNEEDQLPKLLNSLRRQDLAPLEIVVVDDGSTDRTAEVARGFGAKVIPSEPLPKGWCGKTWACHQGSVAARGEVLLFVDADTSFEPNGLRRVFDTYLRHRGVMSLGAYHVVVHPYEQLSAFFTLLMTAGVGAFTVLGTRRPPVGLFGPFLMVDRESYERSGGHFWVKGRMLENMFMAPRFRRLGVRMRCYGGKGTFNIRMYSHGFRELMDGWSKAFAVGAARTPAVLMFPIIAWLSGSILAVALVLRSLLEISSDTGVWLCVYMVFAAQIAFMLNRIGSFKLWTSLLYPVPLLFYLVVFTRSVLFVVLRKGVAWKGRFVAPDGLKGISRDAD